MRPKPLLIVLFLSLAVNLFLMGAVVGGLVIGGRMKGPPRMEMRGGPPLWSAADALPPARRDAYRATLRAETRAAAASFRQARQARREAWSTLAAEPLDKAATLRALNQAHEQELSARATVEAKVVDFAAGLPPAERVALAKGLSQPPRRGSSKSGPER